MGQFEIPKGSRVNSIGWECECILPVDPAAPTAIEAQGFFEGKR